MLPTAKPQPVEPTRPAFPMGRQESIARSIALAVTNPVGVSPPSRHLFSYLVALFSAFFSLYQLALRRIRPADFANLRRKYWEVDDGSYYQSFHRSGNGDSAGKTLRPIGDMGFSGSTFYTTADQKYLVKSLPRHSEYSFFRDDLLTPYVQHMASHPQSIIVRICDFLAASRGSLGRLLGLAPSHHIVMNNILYRQDEAGEGDEPAWEHWDLKPTSYFYPERDIAGGALTTDATKARLADEFPDKIVLTRDQADDFIRVLEEDTNLLADHNAVDYSLFLVRFKLRGQPARMTADPTSSTAEDLMLSDDSPSWRTGIPSTDGQHVFRAAILDFFWAKHKMQPIMMTSLINCWNLLTGQGPMSITTQPGEYRERFLKMVHEYVAVRDDGVGSFAHDRRGASA